MKNIISAIIVLALAGDLASCTSFIEKPLLGQETLDTYFQNEEECLAQLTGCYQAIDYQGWWQIMANWVSFDMATDDLWMGNTSQQSDWTETTHYQNSKYAGGLYNYWQYRYMGILRCNIVLERVPDAPIDEDMKTRILAEARFLRGYYYFELVKNFGGVPIVEGLYAPSDIQGITRASLEETYNFIHEDFRFAIDNLPEKSEYSASDLGRATRGAALGLHGKALLYQEKWQEAADTLQLIIDSGEYELMTEFSQVWSIHTNNNQESLFETQVDDDTQYSLGNRLPVYTGCRNDSGWSWGQPTSDLENAFLAEGDTERLMWTIVKNGDDVPGDPDATNYYIQPSQHKSARIIRKFYINKEERPSPYDDDHNPLGIRILRYADVLLMYAEACNELGRDADARTALNQVRSRVNLPAVTSSGDALRQAIRTERRLELACEFNRLYDIRRWDDTNGKKVICNLFGPNGSFVIYNTVDSTDEYETTNTGERQDKGISFDEGRDLLFPIPNSEILQVPTLEQNPGF